MADIDQNKKIWINQYDWKTQGDEWSKHWGGPDMQWYGAIRPRIQQFVPTGTILKIAPGYGRWTNYLCKIAEKLIIVDLVDNCINYYRKRFSSMTHIEYFINDGRSLDMLENNSIDFAFSFDSLLHAEIDVMHAYI